jgi:hypothetical protein
VDGQGSIIVSDTANNCICMLTPQGLWWLLHYRSSRYVVRLCVVRSSSQVVSSQYSPQATDQESRAVRRRSTDTRTKGTTKYKYCSKSTDW